MSVNNRIQRFLYRKPVRFSPSASSISANAKVAPKKRATSQDQSSVDRITTEDKEKTSNSDRLRAFLKTEKGKKILLVVALTSSTVFVMCLVALSIILPLALTQRTPETTLITTITTTTTTTSTATTTITCVSPYALSPVNGSCVNTLTDLNNCGSIGNVCGSNYTSCSAGVCSTVPVVQLSSPAVLWCGATNGSSDDAMFNLSLPFSIRVYSKTTNKIQLTTNGVICLSTCSNAWIETSLPSSSFGASVLAYWDDLFMYAKTWQGIYYAFQGSAPNRVITLEYYASHFGSPTEYYQFQVQFYEATPGVVTIVYYNAFDTGASCTIGVQGSSAAQITQYSFDQVNSIIPTMTLTFDTNYGNYSSSAIG